MNKLPSRITKNLDFLKKLSKTHSRKKREQIFKDVSNEQLLLLVEICYNVLKGYFPLNRRQKLRILPHVEFVRRLSRVKTEKNARKLIQKGAGFNFAPLLIPIISTILSHYL